mmetsp:Transcript_38271/g.78479  ORF Transcript_38271/g.78479 Transcript_38271/m.78479 type:complete len:82 (-) Transcript_38271:7731-7976(-)
MIARGVRITLAEEPETFVAQREMLLGLDVVSLSQSILQEVARCNACRAPPLVDLMIKVELSEVFEEELFAEVLLRSTVIHH